MEYPKAVERVRALVYRPYNVQVAVEYIITQCEIEAKQWKGWSYNYYFRKAVKPKQVGEVVKLLRAEGFKVRRPWHTYFYVGEYTSIKVRW